MEDEELFTMQDPSINIDDAINNVEFAQSDEDDESEDSFEYEDEAERMNLLEEQLNLAYA